VFLWNIAHHDRVLQDGSAVATTPPPCRAERCGEDRKTESVPWVSETTTHLLTWARLPIPTYTGGYGFAGTGTQTFPLAVCPYTYSQSDQRWLRAATDINYHERRVPLEFAKVVENIRLVPRSTGTKYWVNRFRGNICGTPSGASGRRQRH
jgi:hypothetical protein